MIGHQILLSEGFVFLLSRYLLLGIILGPIRTSQTATSSGRSTPKNVFK